MGAGLVLIHLERAGEEECRERCGGVKAVWFDSLPLEILSFPVVQPLPKSYADFCRLRQMGFGAHFPVYSVAECPVRAI